MTMVNNVIGVVNYVIAARPSLLNFMIADNCVANRAREGSSSASECCWALVFRQVTGHDLHQRNVGAGNGKEKVYGSIP